MSGLQCVLSERWDAGCPRCRIVALDNYSSFIYHNGLKINESFGHLVGPLGESTIARRDSDQQREAVMYSSPKWVSDPESLSV